MKPRTIGLLAAVGVGLAVLFFPKSAFASAPAKKKPDDETAETENDQLRDARVDPEEETGSGSSVRA